MEQITTVILRFLLYLYQFSGGNFGFAIILFTLILRGILAPLSIPTMKTQKKMQELKPHLDKLKTLHGNDKAKLQQEQLRLYKEHNINPLAGCLPFILQFAALILLYQGLNSFLNTPQVNGVTINTMFFGIDLAKEDHTYILPILAGITQLILSVMILPGVESHDLIPDNAKSKKLKKENKKEENVQDMAESIQKQMVFMIPLMTAFAALKFPAGLAVYWVASTVVSIGQQWVVSGPGGLKMYWNKIGSKLFVRQNKERI